MITDLCGFLSLTATLWSVGDACLDGIAERQGNIKATVKMG